VASANYQKARKRAGKDAGKAWRKGSRQAALLHVGSLKLISDSRIGQPYSKAIGRSIVSTQLNLARRSNVGWGGMVQASRRRIGTGILRADRSDFDWPSRRRYPDILEQPLFKKGQEDIVASAWSPWAWRRLIVAALPNPLPNLASPRHPNRCLRSLSPTP